MKNHTIKKQPGAATGVRKHHLARVRKLYTNRDPFRSELYRWLLVADDEIEGCTPEEWYASWGIQDITWTITDDDSVGR